MSGGLVFKYGGYSHPPGEVYPQAIEVRPVVSERGIRWATDVRYQIAGSFCQTLSNPLTPALVNSRIGGLINAYTHDYQDFGFYLPDGSETMHMIRNDDEFNISGNKVLSRSWLYQTPTEFANTRSFSISLGARYLESYSSILFFSERIGLRGTGGPSWQYKTRWTGPPIREQVTERTPVIITQTGVVVGTTGVVQAPAPWWPADEMQEHRYIERVSPRLHGHPDFNKRTHFELRYSYLFQMASVPGTQPRFWIP
jgi:hypothetical protein